MSRRLLLFDPPERFVAGTIGQPGSRTFFLQARDGHRIVSVSLEKAQVAVLAERLGALLDELERRGLAATVDADPPADRLPLDEPLNEAFRAGTLSLGWDGDEQVVVIEAREGEDDVDEVADDDPEGPDLFRVRLSAVQARGFVGQAAHIVAAGRPLCPMCGQPLDPQGHLCPRRNGTFLN